MADGLSNDVRRISKSGVYRRAAGMRALCGFSLEDYPVRLRERCEWLGIAVAEIPLRTQGLRGIAVPGTVGEPDVILLSSGRDESEHNFDAAHEWYHLANHRGLRQSFNCLEFGTPAQDLFLEWQANEGAAELAVPYQLLIPRIVSDYSYLCSSWQAISDLKKEMAACFGVSVGVIKFRLESLRYEIAQAADGVELERLHIWSAARQAREGVEAESLNHLELRLFQRRRAVFRPAPVLSARKPGFTEEMRRRDLERVAELHSDWLAPD